MQNTKSKIKKPLIIVTFIIMTCLSSIKKMKELFHTNDELKKADEVFLTGTAAEITPVIKIETKKIGNGKVGEMTKQIMNAYSEIVMNNNKKFSKWLTSVY